MTESNEIGSNFARKRPEVLPREELKEMRGPSILVARSHISLANEMRERIKSGTQQDSRWAEIYSQLETAQDNELVIGDRTYRLHQNLLEMRDTDKHWRSQWRLVVPDDPELKEQIMRELHEIPYSGHLGYHKTLKNIQRSFYWPEHTLNIRDFVLGCSVCQQEKAVHHVPAGLLQPLKLPEQKWANISMDFIMGLPQVRDGQ